MRDEGAERAQQRRTQKRTSSRSARRDGQPVGGEGRDREGGSGAGQEVARGQGDDVQDAQEPERLKFPRQSPLFHAQNAGRYDRQQVISQYQELYDCRLIVMIDDIFPDSIAYLEDLIFDANPEQDLHLLLHSPGGDGETAVRMIRSLQARCRQLTVLVPDQAKSAATLLVLGAHTIVMGPTSDLGPVDPQFRVPRGNGYDLVAGKDLIEAVDRAEKAVAAQPDTYPLHATLLADVSGLLVATARSAMARTDDLVEECLSGCTGRTQQDAKTLAKGLRRPLIAASKSHAAVFGAADALAAGLPVQELDYSSDQWQLIWRLYMKYRTIPANGIYEGLYASQVLPPLQP